MYIVRTEGGLYVAKINKELLDHIKQGVDHTYYQTTSGQRKIRLNEDKMITLERNGFVLALPVWSGYTIESHLE